MLNIEHYSKTYPGGHKAVDDLSIHVLPGEIYGFIGHNGAGKTTTLRAAAGVMDFTEGRILIDGHDVKKEPVAAKKVTAFLPDNPDLYDFMKGIDYLNFIADLYDISGEQRTRDIRKSGLSHRQLLPRHAPEAGPDLRVPPASQTAHPG